MKLSVVIVNYNVKYFLEQALLSVRKARKQLRSLGPNYDTEIFVVDNNSVDGSIDMIQDKFPDVKLIANKKNIGFSKANNIAIKKAEGEFILLLNPDTVVEEDTFEKCIRFMESHEDAGGLGVKMLDGKGQFLPESKRGFPSPEVAFYKAFGLAALFPTSPVFGKYHLGYIHRDETHEIDVLAGAFMMMRKSVLDEIGLLDETFFMYGEDIDLSYRIKKAGYKNYYFPETRIIHYKGESTKKNSINYVFIFYNAMIIFARKHFRKGKARFFVFLLNVSIYLRASLALVSRFVKKALLPVMDFAGMYGAMYVLKTYWERNHKYVEGGEYPAELMLYQVPIAILIWVLGNYFTFNYSRPFSTSKVLKGTALGTLMLLSVYALLPENLRTSRALILMGAAASFIVFSFNRLILNLFKHKKPSLSAGKKKKVAIIGKPGEGNRVLNLLKESRVMHDFVGFVTPKSNGNAFDEGGEYLGELRQLDEIIKIYDINEVIFCAKDIPSNHIISWMGRIARPELEYKIAPEESAFIMGSNSKNQPGDFYTIDIDLNITKSENKTNKRILDVITALSLLISSPVSIWFVKDKGGLLSNCIDVLLGRKTWVGYENHSSNYTLPKIREGVIWPSIELHKNLRDPATVGRLNFLYARDYGVSEDLKFIWNNLKKLGKRP